MWRSIGVGASLALALAALGGTSGTRSVPGAVAMTPTPLRALALCTASPTLRPVCPRLVPSSGRATSSNVGCFDAHGFRVPLASRRCVDVGWDYYAGAPLPVLRAQSRLSGWDGLRWVSIPFTMEPPPWNVAIDIEASIGSPPGDRGMRPKTVNHLSDILLNPARNETIALGRVRWYGRYGRLMLTSLTTGCGPIGQLTFYFTVHATHYAVTVDTWMSKLRVSGGGMSTVFAAQKGPALPHVIATLKATVASSPGA